MLKLPLGANRYEHLNHHFFLDGVDYFNEKFVLNHIMRDTVLLKSDIYDIETDKTEEPSHLDFEELVHPQF